MIFFHYTKFFNHRCFFAATSSLSPSPLSFSSPPLFSSPPFSSLSPLPPFPSSLIFTATSKFKLCRRIDFSSNLVQPLQQQPLRRHWINYYFVRNNNVKKLQTQPTTPGITLSNSFLTKDINTTTNSNNDGNYHCRRHNTTSSSHKSAGDSSNNSSSHSSHSSSNSSHSSNSNQSQSNSSKNFQTANTKDGKPILKELVHGRTRIYPALPLASSHSPTSSKSSPTTTSSPITWQWQPQTPFTSTTSSFSEERGPVSSFIGSIKQSLSAMFLPVG